MLYAVLTIALVWSGLLCWTDLRERRLPNSLTLGGAAVFLAGRLGLGGPAYFVDGFAAAAVAGLFLLLPFLLHGAGGGDVKMLFAAGALAGWSALLPLLWVTSLAGIVLGLVLIVAGRLDGSRIRHFAHCAFNWRYDRKAGAAGLPPRTSERVRMPFSLPIATGLLVALATGAG